MKKPISKTKKSRNVDKPETLRTLIEAIDRKAHYSLKPGDSALKLLKKWG